MASQILFSRHKFSGEFGYRRRLQSTPNPNVNPLWSIVVHQLSSVAVRCGILSYQERRTRLVVVDRLVVLLDNNTAEKNTLLLTSDLGRHLPYNHTALSKYSIPPAVLDRLRLQNVLDRIEKVSTADLHFCHNFTSLPLGWAAGRLRRDDAEFVK